MKNQRCRWGILGAATIAQKNWQAIHDAGNAELTGVASRDFSKAQAFVEKCQRQVPFEPAPKGFGRYEDLLNHPEIDAIYLPLPTALRKEWAIRAAEAGKHVMVEKPAGVNASEVREILAACERSKVQFMDGVMFAHSRRLSQLKEKIVDGRSIGEVRRMASQFSFRGNEEFFQANIRTNPQLEPLGCLGDLGWYCIRFFLWVMNGELPVKVNGRIDSAWDGGGNGPAVPVEFSGELLFAKGVSASFHCSFRSAIAQWAVISGTEGCLTIPDFVLPFSGSKLEFSLFQSDFQVDGCQFDMKAGRQNFQVDEPSNNAPGSQESNLFRTMSDLVLSGRLDGSWGEAALKTQQVVDACMESAMRQEK